MDILLNIECSTKIFKILISTYICVPKKVTSHQQCSSFV